MNLRSFDLCQKRINNSGFEHLKNSDFAKENLNNGQKSTISFKNSGAAWTYDVLREHQGLQKIFLGVTCYLGLNWDIGYTNLKKVLYGCSMSQKLLHLNF